MCCVKLFHLKLLCGKNVAAQAATSPDTARALALAIVADQKNLLISADGF